MTLNEFKKIKIKGKCGNIETILNFSKVPSKKFVIIAHPHPLFGGTLDNKVVQTIARAALKSNINAVRFNFRGVTELESFLTWKSW